MTHSSPPFPTFDIKGQGFQAQVTSLMSSNQQAENSISKHITYFSHIDATVHTIDFTLQNGVIGLINQSWQMYVDTSSNLMKAVASTGNWYSKQR